MVFGASFREDKIMYVLIPEYLLSFRYLGVTEYDS